jgi:hypothetical protein
MSENKCGCGKTSEEHNSALTLTYHHYWYIHDGYMKDCSICEMKAKKETATRELITTKSGVLRHVIWNGPTSDGHKVELQQTNSDIVWADAAQIVSTGANGSRHDLNYNMNFDGLYVSDMDSGELLLVVDSLQ